MRIMGIASNQIMINPNDFSNDRFVCKNLLKTPDNQIAALVSNRNGIPEYWYVIYGTSRLCFTSSDKAIAYCLKRGFKLADNTSLGGI